MTIQEVFQKHSGAISVCMVDDYDLSNTKSESEYLIDQFVKNFDKEYLIIKKG